MSIAEHVDRRMMSHYSHVRKQARRAALDRLCEKTASGDGDTAQPTAQLNQDGAEPFSQVIERNGGDDETRTRDLCRDSLGIHVLAATYILAGAAKSLKGTVGTIRCG
jgi:hypothetical protein